MAERPSVLALDAAVPVAVGAVIVVAEVAHGGASGTRPLAVAMGVAAAASLFARRRAPGWTLVVSGVLVQTLFAFDPGVAAVAVLAPAVALFSLALTRGRLQQALAAAAAVAAVVLADVLHGSLSVVQTLGHVALVFVPLLAAEALRVRRSNVSLLQERLALAEHSREQEAERRAEQERMRIARDLHDVVAHTLTTINVQAATAAHLLDRNPDHARAALETIETESRDAIGELRAILGVLRTAGGAEAPRAPTPGLDSVPDLVKRARDAGLDVELGVSGQRPDRISDAVSLAAYRVVQESLTNARRHAPGAPVRVDLAFERGEVVVAVENGAGAEANGHASPPGVGLAGLRERAAALGGVLEAAPRATGFRVEARLPYARGPA
ncbi:MAG TPA: histidine kinase [Gaiellales bacterium]|nr:histidine kinase [Gaiellales bacterium]